MNLHYSKIELLNQVWYLKEQHLVCKWFKDPPKQLAGQMKLFLWCDPKVGPTIWEAVIFPAPLIMICQKLLDVKEND